MATKFKKAAPSANLSPEYLGTLKWLTVIQAAAHLQISRSSLVQMMRAGSLPYSRLSARVVRFDRQLLDQWAADNSAVTV